MLFFCHILLAISIHIGHSKVEGFLLCPVDKRNTVLIGGFLLYQSNISLCQLKVDEQNAAKNSFV